MEASACASSSASLFVMLLELLPILLSLWLVVLLATLPGMTGRDDAACVASKASLLFLLLLKLLLILSSLLLLLAVSPVMGGCGGEAVVAL
jgi:hypothetical protein